MDEMLTDLLWRVIQAIGLNGSFTDKDRAKLKMLIEVLEKHDLVFVQDLIERLDK